MPCANNTCTEGLTVGTQERCVPVEVGRTVDSGKSGCGVQAFYWKGSGLDS